ncbi:hypothetical protein HBH70_170450 [Parastagonospora nodorum]|nr:hypothetical protein HBH49_100430 [Parastagonospora nodorum]KAH5131654.1 hypothetical protein HBH70_170450 [Parastagonospora nodorum]KAH5254686.1 hypothetical protein HBI72_138670 [Parastagonospora nodorum]KAH5398814.1 hypothetical protein HBI46_243300 [Parastagonospora nodorum]KAH5413433.1 hypothetical protein HBI32_120480 [Parastagonospora nodorum]
MMQIMPRVVWRREMLIDNLNLPRPDVESVPSPVAQGSAPNVGQQVQSSPATSQHSSSSSSSTGPSHRLPSPGMLWQRIVYFAPT